MTKPSVTRRQDSPTVKREQDCSNSTVNLVLYKKVPKQPSVTFRLLAYTAGKPAQATAIKKQCPIRHKKNGEIKISTKDAKYWWVVSSSKHQSGNKIKGGPSSESSHGAASDAEDLKGSKLKMKQSKSDSSKTKEKQNKTRQVKFMDFLESESEWTRPSMVTCDNTSQKSGSHCSSKHHGNRKQRKREAGSKVIESHVSNDWLGSWSGKLPGVVYSKRPPITLGQQSWPWPWQTKTK